MKNKKRVLTILLALIIIITIILVVVLIFGGIKTKEINDYHEKLEKAACKLAEDENYTEALCEGFEYLCKVKYERLIDKKYIKNNLKNPLNNKLVSEDTKSFVQISWKDGKMICTHKEG